MKLKDAFGIKDPIETPLSVKQLRDLSKDNFIKVNVVCSLSDFIDNDLEGVLDILSEKVTGNELLEDISYKPMGVTTNDELIVEVAGDISSSISGEPYFSVSQAGSGDEVEGNFSSEKEASDWLKKQLKPNGRLHGQSKNDYVVEEGEK